jgi:hypothetical protein
MGSTGVSNGSYFMVDMEAVIRRVARAHSDVHDSWSDEKSYIRRVLGGMNNALYHVRVDGVELACKLYVPDGRQRARREYRALRLLDEAGVELAPRPLWIDESRSLTPYPAVDQEVLWDRFLRLIARAESWNDPDCNR